MSKLQICHTIYYIRYFLYIPTLELFSLAESLHGTVLGRNIRHIVQNQEYGLAEGFLTTILENLKAFDAEMDCYKKQIEELSNIYKYIVYFRENEIIRPHAIEIKLSMRQLNALIMNAVKGIQKKDLLIVWEKLILQLVREEQIIKRRRVIPIYSNTCIFLTERDSIGGMSEIYSLLDAGHENVVITIPELYERLDAQQKKIPPDANQLIEIAEYLIQVADLEKTKEALDLLPKELSQELEDRKVEIFKALSIKLATRGDIKEGVALAYSIPDEGLKYEVLDAISGVLVASDPHLISWRPLEQTLQIAYELKNPEHLSRIAIQLGKKPEKRDQAIAIIVEDINDMLQKVIGFAGIARTLIQEGDLEGAKKLIFMQLQEKNQRQAFKALVRVCLMDGKLNQALEFAGIIFDGTLKKGLSPWDALFKFAQFWIESNEGDRADYVLLKLEEALELLEGGNLEAAKQLILHECARYVADRSKHAGPSTV